MYNFGPNYILEFKMNIYYLFKVKFHQTSSFDYHFDHLYLIFISIVPIIIQVAK